MRTLLCGLLIAGLASTARSGDDKIEPDFKPLFNGKNLDGWKMQGKKDALDGQAEAFKGRFKVKDGKIVIDYQMKGNAVIESVKTFDKDVHIKFDFLPGPKCNNDLYIRGHKFDLVKGNVKNYQEGEWHKFEIIVKGDTTEFKCNGEVQRTAKNKSASSPLGIRAEFGEVQIKNIRYKE